MTGPVRAPTGQQQKSTCTVLKQKFHVVHERFSAMCEKVQFWLFF